MFVVETGPLAAWVGSDEASSRKDIDIQVTVLTLVLTASGPRHCYIVPSIENSCLLVDGEMLHRLGVM